MVLYTINDIEQLTGVKAHTIRMWEKRFNILPNRRTNTNIRYYLDEDLQFIANIAALNKKGLKISKIAEMPICEIKHQVACQCSVGLSHESEVDVLLLCILDLDEYKFQKIINHYTDNKGLEHTLNAILFPLLDKIEYLHNLEVVKTVHKDFVRQIIERKLVAELDKINQKVCPFGPKILLVMPESGDHLRMLNVQLALKYSGYQVLYFGNEICEDDLLEIGSKFKPTHGVFTSNDIIEMIKKWITFLPTTTFIGLGLSADNRLPNPNELSFVKDINGLKNILNTYHEESTKRQSKTMIA